MFFFANVLFNILQTKSINILYFKEQLDKARAILEKKLDEFAAFHKMLKEKHAIDMTGLTRRGNNKSINPQQHLKCSTMKFLLQ